MPLSVFAAAVPLLVVAYMLGIKKIASHKSTAGGVLAVLLVAGLVFRMPPDLLMHSAISGAVVGLTFALVIVGAITFYITINKTGQFSIIRQSILMATPDPRLQVLLIAFCFGGFLEAIAGGGTPVVITVAMLVGIGFAPFYAARICLLANSTPVAFGAIGLPAIVLAMVTKIPLMSISKMCATQIPLISLLVPIILVSVISGWKGVKGIWPAIATVSVVFSGTQYLVATYLGPLLPDVVASLASMIALIALQRVWQPKTIWKFGTEPATASAAAVASAGSATRVSGAQAHGVSTPADNALASDGTSLTTRQIVAAWIPMVILIVIVGIWGR
jgi:lactate permease